MRNSRQGRCTNKQMPPPLPRAVNGNSFAALECNRYTNYGNRGTLAAVMSMSVRWPFVYASVLMALGSGGIASADDLSPEQARAFVVDKLFDYTCFDGTTGMVRIFSDGSVVGTITSGQRTAKFRERHGRNFFHVCSRITSNTFLSLRSRRKAGCRISPSLVHSVNFTSPTSLGISQVVAFSSFTF